MIQTRYRCAGLAALGLLGCAQPATTYDVRTSASIVDPSTGGPFGERPTHWCSNLGNTLCYADNAPLTRSDEVKPYLDNAATNWGCTNLERNRVESAGGGNYLRRYDDCGVVWWNQARQAAYFEATSTKGALSALTSSQIYAKHCALGCSPSGPLGLPVSNPTPYGKTGVTYQQFTRGLITQVAGAQTAYAIGGAAVEDQALAARYAAHFGVDPTAGPPIHGLTGDAGCTSDPGTPCSTGRYARWRDASTRVDEMVLARTGWRVAVLVTGPILARWTSTQGATAPWAGALGFPISDLLPTGSATYHQEFERGTILWEREGCTSGAYVARIAMDLRRPITAGNLSMLCEAAPPPNLALTPETQPTPFTAGGQTGTYTFAAGRDSIGWYQGVRVRFAGGPPIEVTGAFFDAWLEGPTSRATVVEALASGAAGWGEPSGDAECVDNPCTLMKQRFAHGFGSLGTSGVLEWVEEDPHPGLLAPIGLGAVAWGYAFPPIPADIRALGGLERSGDFVRLAWLNRSTAANVVTRLYRAARPLGGVQGQFTEIATMFQLGAGTSTTFTDSAAVNNAQNCYYLSVTDETGTLWSPQTCIYTLDATVDSNGVHHSIIRSIGRARLTIDVAPSPTDSGTTKHVAARLTSNGGGFDYNLTYLDTTAVDFQLGSTNTFDLGLAGGSNNPPPDLVQPPIDVADVADIDGIEIFSFKSPSAANDNLRISRVALTLDNVLVFEKTFATPFLVSNSSAIGGTTLVIPFDELRTHPHWKDIYAAGLTSFVGLEAAELRKKVDAALGNVVLRSVGADYHGSRLRDDTTSSISRLAEDRIRVVQQIRASQVEDVNCTVRYELQIIARDLAGNLIDHLQNPVGPGGFGAIFANEMLLENPDVSCTSAWWKVALNGLVSVLGFEDRLGTLESDLKRAFTGMAPTRVAPSPLPNLHLCFPAAGQFAGGGFSVCSG